MDDHGVRGDSVKDAGELGDEELEHVSGGGWMHAFTQASKTAASVSKTFHDAATSVIENIA